MVVSEVTRTRTRKDKGPVVNAPAPPEVQDASESSWANPRSASPRLLERKAYVMVDALKKSISTMTDTIMRQVLEHVQRAMEAANASRPLPYFDYVPTTGCEPSY